MNAVFALYFSLVMVNPQDISPLRSWRRESPGDGGDAEHRRDAPAGRGWSVIELHGSLWHLRCPCDGVPDRLVRVVR